VVTGERIKAAALLEREPELKRLRDHLALARAGDGRFVLVEGPPGIGKTTLLAAWAHEAADAGLTVLSARGDEVTRESSFAAVRELLWSARPRGVPDAGEAAALAAPVFGDDARATLASDRVATVLHGLYWLTANLVERGPVLAVVDDLHWLDVASLRFLAYLARRLDGLPLLIVAAARPGEVPRAADVASALRAAAADVIEPRPLSPAATAAVVRRDLGGDPDPELCDYCHWATNGNPFYLHALLGAIGAVGGPPSVELARVVGSEGTDTVARDLRGRFAALGAAAERLSEALAVLGRDSPLRMAAAVAGLQPAAAQDAADRLRVADLLAGGDALSFVHPLVRGALLAGVSESRQMALNDRAARLLADEHAPPGRVAVHLLGTEPSGEPWVVSTLRAAAAAALSAGAPETAVSYMRRALDEPPRPDQRLVLLRELGRAEMMLPDGGDSAALREALLLACTDRERAEVTLDLVVAMSGRGLTGGIAELVCELLDSATELDADQLETLEGMLIGAGAADLRRTEEVLARTEHHFRRARAGELPSGPFLAPALSQTGPVTGRLPATVAATLARRALARDAAIAIPPRYLGACGALIWCDRLGEAAAALDAAIGEAQRRGSSAMFMQMSVFRAAAALRAGEIDTAEAHGQRAFELAHELGAGTYGIMFLLGVLLERGRPEAALELADEVAPACGEIRYWQDAMVVAERGRALVATGRLQEGLDELMRASEAMAAAGCRLSALCDWAPATVATLCVLGRLDEARALASAELADAVAFGAPRGHGTALAAHASVAPADERERLQERAVVMLEHSEATLAHGRTLAGLGAARLAAGRPQDARPPLSHALDIAARCGSEALRSDALELLRATGARPRRAALTGVAALTPAELRTSRLAAGGMSNREIAQALFLSAKTVETQLSSAYRKLEVFSRAELGSALDR